MTRTRDDILEDISLAEEKLEDARDEVTSQELKIEELQDELAELDEDEEADSLLPEFVSAVEDLIASPELAEWERLEWQDKLFTGEINPRDVLSRFYAIGKGVPAAVYDQIKESNK